MAAGAASVWNPDNIRDVAESVGLAALSPDAVNHLTRDVEFRLSQVLAEAIKHMRRARRTTMHTKDISLALRTLDVEPLYGYDSTRPLRFGEAIMGPGQPLFYVEDEEVDFEKLINAPLPRVPREITFTAHWLAIEGVQPTIPQNPTQTEVASRETSLLPKGPGANPHLAATAGADNVSIKPLVKHVLSKELQLFFEQVCIALLDEVNPENGAAALAALREDPGIHQLVPYFVQYVAEKVTHSMKSLFVLGQMLHLVESLLQNSHLYMAPYAASLVPPVLTCLVGRKLGGGTNASNGSANFLATLTNGASEAAASRPPQLPAHYPLRDLAASILVSLTRPTFSNSTPTLKPRVARSLLKHLLSGTTQTLGTYYGAIRGLSTIAKAEGTRQLLLPNLAALDPILRESAGLEDGSLSQDERTKRRAELAVVVDATVQALADIEGDSVRQAAGPLEDRERNELTQTVGGLISERILQINRPSLARAVIAKPERQT